MSSAICPCCRQAIALATAVDMRCAWCGAALRRTADGVELAGAAPIVTQAEEARMRAAIAEVSRG